MNNTIQETIHTDARLGGVVELSLDLNENNRIDQAGFARLGELFEKHSSSGDCRALILRSAVAGYFTNGLAPEMFLDQERATIEENVRVILTATARLAFFPKPVVCAMNGHSMGAGAVFAACADFRLMAEKGGCIGFPEAQIAMNFPAFSAKLLSELVGPARARRLLFFAPLLKPKEALEIGLIDSIHPAEELDAEARKLAAKLAGLRPGSSVGIKKAFTRLQSDYARTVLEEDVQGLVETILTADAQEGFRSIAEGRRPNFPE